MGIGLRSILAEGIWSSRLRPATSSTDRHARVSIGLFTKYLLKVDPVTGSLLSVGLEATLPTGPSQFAGAKYIQKIHSTEVQPFLGYLLFRNRFYLHGFLSLSVPSSIRDVTMVYNDLGIGYFVYRSTDPDSALTSIAPTFEVHVNSPLTHRDWFNANDPTGTADVVDLTYGLNATLQAVGHHAGHGHARHRAPALQLRGDSPVQLALRPLPRSRCSTDRGRLSTGVRRGA